MRMMMMMMMMMMMLKGVDNNRRLINVGMEVEIVREGKRKASET